MKEGLHTGNGETFYHAHLGDKLIPFIEAIFGAPDGRFINLEGIEYEIKSFDSIASHSAVFAWKFPLEPLPARRQLIAIKFSREQQSLQLR